MSRMVAVAETASNPWEIDMNIRTLCLGALAISLTSGAVLAASDTTALDNHDTMKPFYSDSDMKTLVPEAEFKAAWMKLTKEDQDKIVRECSEDAAAKAHGNFCAMTRKFGEAHSNTNSQSD